VARIAIHSIVLPSRTVGINREPGGGVLSPKLRPGRSTR
jgi:hypothetical protein